jgi:hypothetical protein
MPEEGTVRRTPQPPAWILKPDGSKRQLETGRWSMERVAEIFTDDPDILFSVDKIAVLIYGSNGKKNRENVRKHIPRQRTYMLSRLIPIITRYGARGRILAVKLYDRQAAGDKLLMQEELDRLRLRKELSRDRYLDLCSVLGLTPEE